MPKQFDAEFPSGDPESRVSQHGLGLPQLAGRRVQTGVVRQLKDDQLFAGHSVFDDESSRFGVPPVPQVCLKVVASSCKPASSSGTSDTVVTPLRRRPFVSRPTRTTEHPPLRHLF